MLIVDDNRCPVYLSESVQPVSSNPVRQRLRSASSLDYIVPRTKTKFGDRAFSVAGPTVWNSLPESVRSAETLSSWKASWKLICSTCHFNRFLSLNFFINIVMPSRCVFVVGWALNYIVCCALVLLCINQYTKFEVPSFNYKHMIGQNLKSGSRDSGHAPFVCNK